MAYLNGERCLHSFTVKGWKVRAVITSARQHAWLFAQLMWKYHPRVGNYQRVRLHKPSANQIKTSNDIFSLPTAQQARKKKKGTAKIAAVR